MKLPTFLLVNSAPLSQLHSAISAIDNPYINISLDYLLHLTWGSLARGPNNYSRVKHMSWDPNYSSEVKGI
jgi:hypothetical protein